ncbi:MerR family transcriptional regulator, partial [Streptomyces avermitilis]
ARELVDHGTPIEAACRIVILEDQLEEAQRINAEYRRTAESAHPTAAA